MSHQSPQSYFSVRYLLSRALLFAICLGQISCLTPSPKPVVDRPPGSSYKAISGTPRNQLPTVVYLFPPLKCDPRGNPVEQMKMSGSLAAGDAEWYGGNPISNRIREKLTKKLREDGYQVITFPELLKVRSRYSVMVISTFFSDRLAVEKPLPGQPDQYIFSRLLAKSFNIDLNPATAKNLSQVDGTSYFYKKQGDETIEWRSIVQLFDYTGENVEGQSLF